jgi:hypothetical protein
MVASKSRNKHCHRPEGKIDWSSRNCRKERQVAPKQACPMKSCREQVKKALIESRHVEWICGFDTEALEVVAGIRYIDAIHSLLSS